MTTHSHLDIRPGGGTGTAAAAAGPAPCPCGCAECPEECGLDCIERPIFNGCQLLEADDLTAIVDWARQRLDRLRLRDGWGVVCGLDVRCDHAHRGRIVVEAGYAVGCCGEDIVLCQEQTVDLSCACDPRNDPCAKEPPRETGLSSPCTPLTAVDILLEPDETLAEPRVVLELGSCGGQERCEPTRTREGGRIVCRPVLDPSSDTDARDAAEARWLKGWTACNEVIASFQSAFPETPKTIEPILTWFAAWTAEHPLHYLCCLHDWLCAQERSEPLGARGFLLPLVMLQDYRNAFLAGSCASCAPDSGVPLARVWLTGTQKDCRVTAVRPFPPYRRPLTLDRWPAGPGRINIGRFIWQTVREARVGLADLGVALGESWSVTEDEMQTVIDHAPVLEWGTGFPKRVVALTLPDVACGHTRLQKKKGEPDPNERIVAFLPTSERVATKPTEDDQPTGTVVLHRDDAIAELVEVDEIGTSRAQVLWERSITRKKLATLSVDEVREIFPALSEKGAARVIASAEKLSG